jgi:ABC-type transport system substrate-binding protein
MKLVIYTTMRSGRLLTILAMPFFQATSTRLPLDREVAEVRGINDLPTAGPYAFALNDVNRLTSLRRNPYWSRGPGRTAPRNLKGLDLFWNLNEQSAFEEVEANQLDEGPVPAAELQDVANRYGVNRSRFWVKPTNSCIAMVAFNNSRGLFHDNVQLRKAVSWAIDRTDYLGDRFTRSPWTHLLPPGYPGSITKPRLQPYSPRANLAKARALAAGHFGDGRINAWYRLSGNGPAQAEVVRRSLVDLGFDPQNITMKGFAGADIYDAIGKRGSEFDLAVSIAFCDDFVDPANVDHFPFLPLNQPYFPDDAMYRNRIAATLRLRGNARVKAIGKLDIEIMNKLAPFVVTNTYNNRFFFSNRVDTRSLRYHSVYEDWSIPALALK